MRSVTAFLGAVVALPPAARSHRWQGVGNLLKMVISILGTGKHASSCMFPIVGIVYSRSCACGIVTGTDETLQETCFALHLPDTVTNVMKEAPDESTVRKNASVVMAKLAKYPKVQPFLDRYDVQPCIPLLFRLMLCSHCKYYEIMVVSKLCCAFNPRCCERKMKKQIADSPRTYKDHLILRDGRNRRNTAWWRL